MDKWSIAWTLVALLMWGVFAMLMLASESPGASGSPYGRAPALDDPWPKVVEVQRDLARIGRHRGPSPMDILIALTAEQQHLTVLHVDDDFAAIAKVRPGIPMVRGEARSNRPSTFSANNRTHASAPGRE
ncbi:PIN domain-containing protein [Streptomyces kebangsaanensis]|uniref:hypothetical protein n=1 Tax=Streptomyces kebangsaanensis TaxID=864058 RepID=UPI001F1FCDFC|nr:hypothetical protein [Streptomyces kebangsaanensis]